MECLLGLLKVRVVRGVHLAICDPLTHSSDPYVVLRHGQQVNCMPLHQLRSYSIVSPSLRAGLRPDGRPRLLCFPRVRFIST